MNVIRANEKRQTKRRESASHLDRVIMGVRHLGHDEAMEAGGPEVVRSIPDQDTIVG